HSLVLSGISEIKKGRKGPGFRAPPRLAGGLSTPGGALAYENRNKSPHGCALRSDAQVIGITAAPVKPNAAESRRRRKRRTSNARLKSIRRTNPQSLTNIKCLTAAANSRRRRP